MHDCAAPVAQDTDLFDRATGQKEEPKKAVSKESFNAGTNVQLGETEKKESMAVVPRRKRALTPPFISGEGILQTWPGFGFQNVSEEGVRALRKRGGKMEHPERPRTIRSRSKGLRGPSIERKSNTVPAESSEQGCIDKQDSKQVRLHNVLNSLPTGRQAASTKVSDNRSPTSEEDSAVLHASLAVPNGGSLAVQATAVQRSQKPSNDTGHSPWR